MDGSLTCWESLNPSPVEVKSAKATLHKGAHVALRQRIQHKGSKALITLLARLLCGESCSAHPVLSGRQEEQPDALIRSIVEATDELAGGANGIGVQLP